MDTQPTARKRTTLGDLSRAWPLLLTFAVCFAVTVWLSPVKVGLTVFGLAKIALGAFLGYWIDRLLFPYARPHTLTGEAAGASWKRRAIIVAACVIAAALIP